MSRTISDEAGRAMAILALAAGILLTAVGTGVSQETIEFPDKPYRYMHFNAGDLDDRIHAHAMFNSADSPRILMVSPEGLSAEIYYENAFGEPGWLFQFADHGWNAYAMDPVGCGGAPPTTTDDLLHLTERSIFGLYRFGTATQSTVLLGHGLGSAFIIKLRSTTPNLVPCAVLIDPIGPQGAQPETELTVSDLIERRDRLDEVLWPEWGIGPELGQVYPGSDLGQEGFDILRESYQEDRPRYWAAALTGLRAWLRVDNPIQLTQFPVLVLRSPRRTETEIAREESVVAWLREQGAVVEQKNLADLGLEGLSNLPMAGHDSAPVAEAIYEWIQAFPPVVNFQP